jgi:pullulanase/glycogen debranching enzyme
MARLQVQATYAQSGRRPRLINFVTCHDDYTQDPSANQKPVK